MDPRRTFDGVADTYHAIRPGYPPGHGLPHEGPPAASRADVDTELRAALDADPRFDAVRLHRYDWDQTYTAAGYRSLQETFSVTQLMPPDAREALLDDLEALILDRFDDEVTRPLVATLTIARRAPLTARD